MLVPDEKPKLFRLIRRAAHPIGAHSIPLLRARAVSGSRLPRARVAASGGCPTVRMDVDVRRLPMASYLGVPPAPQPVVYIWPAQNGGVVVHAQYADAQLVLAGGVLRRASDALLATDLSWSVYEDRGSHATMTPTQAANQLLDRGFRTQHLRFMSGLGYLQWQQEQHWIAPPRSYFGAPAGESPFYRTQLHCVMCGRCLCGRCQRDAIHANPRDDGSESDAAASSASGDDDDESDSDAPASSASGDDEELPHYDDEGNTTPPPRPRSPAITMLTAARAFPRGAGPSTSESSDDDFGDDIWQSGDESGDERSRSRSRSPRHARRRVTTSQ